MENENLERPNYYAVIPANVRYSDVSASAKLLYAEVTSLANKTGTCWASNKYFADLYGVTSEAVSGWVKQLVEAGFVSTKIIKSQGNRRYIRITDVPIQKNLDTYPKKVQVNNNKINNNSFVELEKNLLALVNKVTGRNFRTLPERGVKKTLDAFSLEEIEMALRALANDSWHREKLKELNISYLTRSTTIDKFLDVAKSLGGKNMQGAASLPPSPDEEDLSKFANQKPPEGLSAADHNKWVAKKMEWERLETERFKKEKEAGDATK